MNLFQQAEQRFDKLFGYNRQQSESFDYHNTTKNSPIYEQLKRQEQNVQSNKRKIEINQDCNQENLFSINKKNQKGHNQNFNLDMHISTKKDIIPVNSPFPAKNSQISISFISPEAISPLFSEEQKSKLKKRKGCRLYLLYA